GSSIIITSKLQTQDVIKYWSPSVGDKSPQIILDLEHCYVSLKTLIKKSFMSSFSFTVATSVDRENWTENKSVSARKFSLNTKCKTYSTARYLKLTFDDVQTLKLKHILVYEK
ncbi:MAG: hypothetical protein RR405_06205, partial [Clostridia bacterium]